jgi:hypothetical protein
MGQGVVSNSLEELHILGILGIDNLLSAMAMLGILTDLFIEAI